MRRRTKTTAKDLRRRPARATSDALAILARIRRGDPIPAAVKAAADTARSLRADRRTRVRYPVRIRWHRFKDPKTFADCTLYKPPKARPFFEIRLNPCKLTTRAEVEDTILHEWAHALTWYDVRLDDHDAVWGAAYAQAYRVVGRCR